MNKSLIEAEWNYTLIEKQAYALVQALKHFRGDVGYSRVVAYVPHAAIKEILV
jgi:hypothetical protein